MNQYERLDVALVKKNIAKTRQKAKNLIITGNVKVNNKVIQKPSFKVDELAKFEIIDNPLPYVSRGGLKLEKAIDSFNINLYNKTAFDIGSSTGGFTDCMLQNGASKVFSIDVGTDQLDISLRNDPRVVVMENTNIRYLDNENLNKVAEFASIDVSFISLTKVLDVVTSLLSENGEIVALIKPQFEAGKKNIGKKGVVKNKKIHEQVIKNIITYATNLNLKINGLDYSPIKGPKGNIEYLLYVSKTNCMLNIKDYENTIKNIVLQAHNELKLIQ